MQKILQIITNDLTNYKEYLAIQIILKFHGSQDFVRRLPKDGPSCKGPMLSSVRVDEGP